MPEISFLRSDVQEFENRVKNSIRDVFGTIAWSHAEPTGYDSIRALGDAKTKKESVIGEIREYYDKLFKNDTNGSSESKCNDVVKSINNIRNCLNSLADEVLRIYQGHEHYIVMSKDIDGIKAKLIRTLYELERETNTRVRQRFGDLNISGPTITDDTSVTMPQSYHDDLQRCVNLTEGDAVDEKTGRLLSIADSFINSFLRKYSKTLGEEKKAKMI